MTEHPDYQKGIEHGADMLAQEIDQLCLAALKRTAKMIDQGKFVGTREDFRRAQEDFKHHDIAKAIRKMNKP